MMRNLNPNFSPHYFHWSHPSKECGLSNDEVHVWATDLDDESHLPDCAATLSVSEKERAARFHFERDQKRFIAGRGLLRAILGCYTKTPAASLQFGYGKNGKPHLTNAAEFGDLDFNLSHSGNLALFAVARDRDLGIDLENVRSFSDMDEIAARCFLPEEQRVLRLLRSPQKEECFFRCWTRTEAQLKCKGEGFSDYNESHQKFDGFIQELRPTEGCIATLAVHGKPFTLKTRQLILARPPRLERIPV